MTYAELADAIDPRMFPEWDRAPSKLQRDLIAASDALRQHAAALEIGRGIGREEAAKIADGWLQQFRDRKIDFVRAEKFASDAVADIRDLIRAAPLALDVEALVERVAAIIEPSMEQPASGAAQRVARAVIAALGVGE